MTVDAPESTTAEKVVEKIKQIITPISDLEKQINLISEIAESIYPGNWDLSRITEEQLRSRTQTSCLCTECSGGNRDKCPNGRVAPLYRLVIKFPEATIRNSIGQTHHIKDFHVAVILDQELKKAKSTNLYSLRTTATTLEYACGAIHPHSTVSDENGEVASYFSWRNMCLGGQTALTDIMFTLYSDGISSKSLHELLIMLNVYVGWESLDGGPYKRMETFLYPTSSRASRRNSLDVNYVYKLFLLELYKETLEFPRPELVGNSFLNLSITNVTSSITPVVKKVIIDGLRNGVFNRESVLPYFGTETATGGFVSLIKDVANTHRNLAFYKNRINEMPSFNRSLASKRLMFHNEPAVFTLELEPNGIVDGNAEVITEDDIKNAQIYAGLVTSVVQNYLNHLKQFTRQQLF